MEKETEFGGELNKKHMKPYKRFTYEDLKELSKEFWIWIDNIKNN